jgi:hypothetical protein
MPDLMRVRAVWLGTALPGGGVSTFYFADGSTGALAAVRAFFAGITSSCPTGLAISFPGTGDIIDEASGLITSSWTQTPPANATGSAGGGWAAGVGARVVWNTGARRRGRLTRGTTFICPLGSGAYDTDGTLTGTALSNMQNAAATLIADSASELRVWSRPDPGASNGGSAPVTSATVPDKVSWLTTRRT